MQQDRKARVQLTSAQKDRFKEKIELASTDEYLTQLLHEWNDDTKNPQISLSHLQRIREAIPKFKSAEQFFASVEAGVKDNISSPDAAEKWHLANPDNLEPLDASKIPLITKEQKNDLSFDFDSPKYTESRNKVFKSDFRNHLQRKGMAIGSFSKLVSDDDRAKLDKDMPQNSWIPSVSSGPWKIVGDFVFENGKRFRKKATFSNVDEAQSRVNPCWQTLKEMCEPGGKQRNSIVYTALVHILVVVEAVYSYVYSLLPNMDRSDSKRRMYEGVPQHLSARFFSFLSCLDKATTVQIEHMDDYYKGLSVLWGLVENQYVIVWLNSYELNLELETINEFREQVTSRKPANWSDDDFWNLVAGVHLENSGFTKDKLPSKASEDSPSRGRSHVV